MSEGDFQRKDLVMRKKICRLYVQCIAIEGFHSEKFYFSIFSLILQKIFGNEKENLSALRTVHYDSRVAVGYLLSFVKVSYF